MSAHTAESKGLAALLLGAVCIGFAPLWVRWSETGPVATAFHRVLLALPALGLWALRERPSPSVPWSPADRRWTLAAGAFFALDLAAWHLAIRFTSVANATLLANFAPIFVSLGAWFFLRESVAIRFAMGMILAFGGAWLLTGASLATDAGHVKGDLLGLITAVFYGAYQLSVARLRRRHPAGRVLFFGSLACVPILGIIAWSLHERLLPVSMHGWLVLVGLAVTAQVLGQGLITYGFAHLPAGYSSVTLLLQPLVAAAAAWMLLGEGLSAGQCLGGCILLTGIFLARHTSTSPSTAAGNSAGSPAPASVASPRETLGQKRLCDPGCPCPGPTRAQRSPDPGRDAGRGSPHSPELPGPDSPGTEGPTDRPQPPRQGRRLPTRPPTPRRSPSATSSAAFTVKPLTRRPSPTPIVPPELRGAWQRIQRAVNDQLDAINFQQLSESGLEKDRMYYI
jgi:drug/metabolite transporter (DMT)-like permease